MRTRALVALILTPPIAGIVYAVVGQVASRSVSPDYRTGPGADFVVGCVSGLAFEIVVLLPLARLAARRSWSRAVLWLVGCCIWFAVSLAFFSFFYVDSDAVIATSLQLLIPGVVLSAAFTFLFAGPTNGS